jgi:hypothetical protein
MKKLALLTMLCITGTAAVAFALPAAGATAPTVATVTIRHQTRGCHSWSVNGNAYAAKQSVALARGGTLVFTDNDVMAHTLVKVAGPSVRMYTPAMKHMGATSTVAFTHRGTYVFTTKEGEDFMAGVKTVGPDNVLRLTVRVS